ncbi:MAG: hypothetical protein KIT20_12620 [Alphaproteobacteria bacterium]|nr:hypothetical protein [Alphaproteobacteria bacterium]
MSGVRLAIVATFGLWLSGCASFASIAVETFDAKISQLRDERCHLAHLAFGRSYCQSKRIDREEEPRHCVKTLGDVDCYAVAAPASAPTSATAPAPAPAPAPASTHAVAAPEAAPAEPAPDLRLTPAPRAALAQR